MWIGIMPSFEHLIPGPTAFDPANLAAVRCAGRNPSNLSNLRNLRNLPNLPNLKPPDPAKTSKNSETPSIASTGDPLDFARDKFRAERRGLLFTIQDVPV